MPAFAEGLTVTYQGFTCSPLFEFSRSAGIEPDFGFVHVERADLGVFQVSESLPGVDTLQATTQSKNGNAKGLFSSGTLQITEVVDGKQYQVTASQVLVSEKACEIPFATEDSSDLVRVEITDIRYLWKTRGILFAWINVPSGLTSSPIPASGRVGPTVAKQISYDMAPGSLRGNATPWTVRQVLEEKILPALPGSPKLKRCPTVSADRDRAKSYVWNGVLPKEALAQVLKDMGWIFTLNLDGTVSCWDEGEGVLQDDRGLSITFQGNNPAGQSLIDNRVAEARGLISFHYTPAAVLVLGPPIHQNIRMDLEPVGDLDGQIVPLAEALEKIGISDKKPVQPITLTPAGQTLIRLTSPARKFVFLDHHMRTVVAGDDATCEFERWAFKWFRIAGLPDQNAERLPLLPRADVDAMGEVQPYRVWCETVSVMSLSSFALREAAIKGVQIDPYYFRNTAQGQIEYANRVKEIQAQKFSENYHIVVNVPYQELSRGYSVNAELGIVQFHTPVGQVPHNPDNDGWPPLDAAAFIHQPLRAAVEFGYKLKPSQNDPVQLSHRYYSVWVRSRGSAMQQVDRNAPPAPITAADLQQLPVLPPELMPLTIYRPELQQVNDWNGQTNKSVLDALAKTFALDVMRKPQAEAGAIVSFCYPTPVVNTGKVLSVRWRGDSNGLFSGTAHLGTFAPLAPMPDPTLHTRAFGEQSASVNTTFTPL